MGKERMTVGGRTNRSQYVKFLKAWQKAGRPRNFRCDKNFQRLMDSAALREQLDHRTESAEERYGRQLASNNELRYKMMKMNI